MELDGMNENVVCSVPHPRHPRHRTHSTLSQSMSMILFMASFFAAREFRSFCYFSCNNYLFFHFLFLPSNRSVHIG